MLRLRVVTVAVAVALLAGCGGPPKTRESLLYRGLSENLPRLDPSILSGRRIVIDPGHGGHFRGTLGQNGLAESMVNLGVSLYLWGLLREAGAEVHLTRSAEKDFLSDSDSTLAGELAVRVAMVDSLEPDILISIHHNAQNDRDPSKNAVETYYRFGDPGSRDLAFAVHRHLMRNLGIEEGEVRPGNYFILRNVDVTAILGEGSYLTHPSVEDNLRLSDKQRLEAEAYFLGVLEYFSRGTPRFQRVAPLDSILDAVPTLAFDVDDVGGLGIDPGAIDLRLNGDPAAPFLQRSGTRIAFQMPWDAPNGPYDVSLGVRNLLGNSSEIRRFTFQLNLPAETVAYEFSPPSLPRTGGTARVRARLLDRRGIAIADGTPVQIEASAGTAPAHAIVERGAIEFPVSVAQGQSKVTLALIAQGKRFEMALSTSDAADASFRKLVIADSLGGDVLKQATILYDDSLIATGSHSGTYFFPTRGDSGAVVSILAAGFRPMERSIEYVRGLMTDTLWVTPWYGGKLLGLRFMLDPEGGFGRGPGMGKLGLSGPFVSLRVAHYLEEYLEAAGANVELTRRTEETLSPRDVVAVTDRFGADRYIEIRHRAAPKDTGLVVSAYYFPGSSNGRAMAAEVQRALSGALGLAEREPAEAVTFPLQQTACPAIVVEAPSIESIDEELRLSEPWYQRKQAYAVFLGILAHFGVDPGHTLGVVIETDTLAANWLVTLDRTWRLLTPPDGDVTFAALIPGAYLLELRRGGVLRRQRVIVDPSTSAALPYKIRLP